MPIYPLTAVPNSENSNWKLLPLFQGYEINSNRKVRRAGSEKILKPTPHRKQLSVSIWDNASHKQRTVSIDYLWEMAKMPILNNRGTSLNTIAPPSSATARSGCS